MRIFSTQFLSILIIVIVYRKRNIEVYLREVNIVRGFEKEFEQRITCSSTDLLTMQDKIGEKSKYKFVLSFLGWKLFANNINLPLLFAYFPLF